MEQKTIVYITKNDAPSDKKWHSKAGRQLLRFAMQEVYGDDTPAKNLGQMPGGKPCLPPACGWYFNLSHSQAYVVCALAREEIGIDIQYHKPIKTLENVARRTLSTTEYHQYHQSNSPAQYFFDRWVEKESYLKWTGEGITRDLRTLEITGYCCHITIAPTYSCALYLAHPQTIELHYIPYSEVV